MNAPLIAASLLANAALFAVLAARPALAPAGVQDFLLRRFHSDRPAASAPAKKPAAAAPAKLWSALHHGDPQSFVARLRAAGFPPSVIRALVSAEIAARYDERLRALQEPDPTIPFWKQPTSFYMAGDKRLEEINQLHRERARLLRDLFKDEFFAADDMSASQRRQYGNLSRSQLDAVQRIEDDYAEMIAAVRAEAKGIILPEDRDKLALLAREKRADLATVLSAQELADHELRTSQTSSMIRSRLGSFEPSEAEFRALYQAQVALNEKFPGSFDSIDYQTREAVQRSFHDQLRASLGEARYADYVRETSSDYQQLTRLVQRANLPAATALQTYEVRNAIAAESNAIFDNPQLNESAKRAALQALAQGARNRLLAALGPAAGPEYVRISESWLGSVERGAAVSFARGTTLMLVTDQGSMSFSGGPEMRRLPPAPPPGR